MSRRVAVRTLGVNVKLSAQFVVQLWEERESP